MTYEAWNLRVGKDTARAILVDWYDVHTAVFKIFGKLGKFRDGNTIRVNMDTLVAELVLEPVQEAV